MIIITIKQYRYIMFLERNKMTSKFKGKTKQEAIDYIDEYKDL